MKRFNVRILALVALLTIGLTAFTKFDKKRDLTVVTNCYGLVSVQFTPTCAPAGIILTTGTTTCAAALARINSKVNSANNFFGVIDCDDTQNFFCCAQLVVDAAPCPGQTKITFVDAGGVNRVNQFAKISAVFCKSTAL